MTPVSLAFYVVTVLGILAGVYERHRYLLRRAEISLQLSAQRMEFERFQLEREPQSDPRILYIEEQKTLQAREKTAQEQEKTKKAQFDAERAREEKERWARTAP